MMLYDRYMAQQFFKQNAFYHIIRRDLEGLMELVECGNPYDGLTFHFRSPPSPSPSVDLDSFLNGCSVLEVIIKLWAHFCKTRQEDEEWAGLLVYALENGAVEARPDVFNFHHQKRGWTILHFVAAINPKWGKVSESRLDSAIRACELLTPQNTEGLYQRSSIGQSVFDVAHPDVLTHLDYNPRGRKRPRKF